MPTIKIEGQTLEVPHRLVITEDLLKLAADAGIIASAEGRQLCSLTIEGREYAAGAEVDLEADCEFITTLTTSTPVG